MTAAQTAEVQARLNVSLRDIVSFFDQAGIERTSIGLMENFIDKHLTVDFLALTEGYGKCMAFINHDELISLLYKSYGLMMDGYTIERKVINKKLKLLKEDKKADPDVITRLQNLIDDIDTKKCAALPILMRLRVMNLIPFKEFLDPSFDSIKHYNNIKAEQKALRDNSSTPMKRQK